MKFADANILPDTIPGFGYGGRLNKGGVTSVGRRLLRQQEMVASRIVMSSAKPTLPKLKFMGET